MRIIKATGTKIFTEVIKTPDEVTPSGIIIVPEQFIEEPQTCCKVISVGEQVKEVVAGDIVVIHPRAGMAVMFDRDNNYRVLNFDEIYGTFQIVQ